MRKNLNVSDTDEFLKGVVRIVNGWINYHAITDNQRMVGKFIRGCTRIILKWHNRRGSRKAMNWNNLSHVLNRIKFPTRIRIISMFTSLPKGGRALSS